MVPGIEILDYMVVLFLGFWVDAVLFSRVAAPIYVPSNSVLGILFFISLPTFAICRPFDNWHSEKYEVISHCVFDWHSLMIRAVEHLFICLLAICVSCLETHIFRSYAHFYGIICFLILNCMSHLCILDVNQIFSPI